MEFELSTCVSLVVKRGNVLQKEGLVMPNGEMMKHAEEEGYKYFGILEVDETKHIEIKELIFKEWF